ncbi:MAG: chromate transporter [Bacillota bacterium]
MLVKNSDTKSSKNDYFKRLWLLMLTFLRIGAFTFGGGYAMISLIEKDVVEKYKWLTSKEMLDVVAIAEATPGVIALNSATYVGAKVAGFWGALIASISVLTPAVIIISCISNVIQQFGDNQYVQWAFLGIRASVTALILSAVFKLGKNVKRTLFSAILMTFSFTLAVLSTLAVIDLDVIYILIASGVIGGLYGYYMRKKLEPYRFTKEDITPFSDALPYDHIAEDKEDNV